MTTVSNWDATSFFERLTDTNILARNKKFRFCKVSGLQGFEDALATLQTTTAFVCVSDTAEGYTPSFRNAPCISIRASASRRYPSISLPVALALRSKWRWISTPIYGIMKPNGCRQQHSRSKHRQIPNRITNLN